MELAAPVPVLIRVHSTEFRSFGILLETLDRAFEPAGGSGLEPVESDHDTGFVAEMTECDGAQGLVRLIRVQDALAFDFLVENTGFEGGDVRVCEMGVVKGCLRDSGELRGGRGGESFSENVPRVEAVTAGVLRRALFAGGGAGAAGFGSVEAREALTLEFGTHELCPPDAPGAKRLGDDVYTRGGGGLGRP